MTTWGDIFTKHVRADCDHGHAAFAADRYKKRSRKCVI